MRVFYHGDALNYLTALLLHPGASATKFESLPLEDAVASVMRVLRSIHDNCRSSARAAQHAYTDRSGSAGPFTGGALAKDPRPFGIRISMLCR
eukprot:1141791-Pelagomonas_calceolata.AAC.5